MIVCVCKAVSERHIRRAVEEGASTVRDLSRQFGLGTCCGKCLPEAKRALCDSLSVRKEPTLGLCLAQGSEILA